MVRGITVPRIVQGFVVASLPFLLGCQVMQTPPGYVHLQPVGDYPYRAVSANGAIIAVRTVENPKEGTLDFWAQAVSNELVETRGYKLDRKENVTSRQGLQGIEMTMRTSVEGIDYVYLLTVFVKTGKVVIFQATGPESAITPDLANIREAIRTSGIL